MSEHIFSIPGSTFRYRIEFLERHLSYHVYKVVKLSGEWPTDQALINLADAGDANVCYNFGGDVKISGDSARVAVYVD